MSRVTNVNKVKMFLHFSKFLKRPLSKFHTDTVCDSNVFMLFTGILLQFLCWHLHSTRFVFLGISNACIEWRILTRGLGGL